MRVAYVSQIYKPSLNNFEVTIERVSVLALPVGPLWGITKASIVLLDCLEQLPLGNIRYHLASSP